MTRRQSLADVERRKRAREREEAPDPIAELVELARPVFPHVTMDSIRSEGDRRPGGSTPESVYSWLLQTADKQPALRARLAVWERRWPAEAEAWAPVPEEPWPF